MTLSVRVFLQSPFTPNHFESIALALTLTLTLNVSLHPFEPDAPQPGNPRNLLRIAVKLLILNLTLKPN